MLNDKQSNGYVRWTQLLWLLSTILLFMATAIINNDRLRAQEDQRIEDRWGSKLDCLTEKVSFISKDIVKIKTVLGIRD